MYNYLNKIAGNQTYMLKFSEIVKYSCTTYQMHIFSEQSSFRTQQN